MLRWCSLEHKLKTSASNLWSQRWLKSVRPYHNDFGYCHIITNRPSKITEILHCWGGGNPADGAHVEEDVALYVAGDSRQEKFHRYRRRHSVFIPNFTCRGFRKMKPFQFGALNITEHRKSNNFCVKTSKIFFQVLYLCSELPQSYFESVRLRWNGPLRTPLLFSRSLFFYFVIATTAARFLLSPAALIYSYRQHHRKNMLRRNPCALDFPSQFLAGLGLQQCAPSLFSNEAIDRNSVIHGCHQHPFSTFPKGPVALRP